MGLRQPRSVKIRTTSLEYETGLAGGGATMLTGSPMSEQPARIMTIPAAGSTRANRARMKGSTLRVRSARPQPSASRQFSLIELVAGIGRRLLRPDAADRDIRAVVALALDRRAVDAAQHRELAGVGEGVRDRALEEARQLVVERIGRGERVVECLECYEEALALL